VKADEKFECTCPMQYLDDGRVGKSRNPWCEIHGTVEATAQYRAKLAGTFAMPYDCLVYHGEPAPRALTLPPPQKILYPLVKDDEEARALAAALPPTRPWMSVTSRANELADRCQTLEDEQLSLLVENAKLRREIERLTKELVKAKRAAK
jgi:hypothetical protein